MVILCELDEDEAATLAKHTVRLESRTLFRERPEQAKEQSLFLCRYRSGRRKRRRLSSSDDDSETFFGKSASKAHALELADREYRSDGEAQVEISRIQAARRNIDRGRGGKGPVRATSPVGSDEMADNIQSMPPHTNVTTTTTVERWKASGKPVYPKVHRKHCSVNTLKYFDVPYEIDRVSACNILEPLNAH